MKQIELTRGNFALVDDEDFLRLKDIKWHAREGKGRQYAATTFYNGRKNTPSSFTCFMHHFIMGRPLNGIVIDHINGDGLDNQKKNLRFATHAENISNSMRRKKGLTVSKYVGVNRSKKRWRSSICVKGKFIHLGIFATEEEAGQAYLKYKKSL